MTGFELGSKFSEVLLLFGVAMLFDNTRSPVCQPCFQGKGLPANMFQTIYHENFKTQTHNKKTLLVLSENLCALNMSWMPNVTRTNISLEPR